MLEDHGIKTSVVPHEGWRYLQEFNGSTFRIPHEGCAGTATELVKQVRDFRVTNNLDLEDMEFEIATYIISISPESAGYKGRSPGRQPRAGTRPKPLLKLIRDHLDDAIKARATLVGRTLALERASACEGCHHNIEWKSKICHGCNAHVIEAAQNLRRLPGFEADDKLRACRLHNVFLPGAIFLEKQLPPRHKEAPPECWMP